MTVVSVFISSSPLLEVMTGSRNPVPRASAGSCLVLQDSETITPLTSSVGKCCWEVRWCSYNPNFNSQWFPLIFLFQCLELATWLSLPSGNCYSLVQSINLSLLFPLISLVLLSLNHSLWKFLQPHVTPQTFNFFVSYLILHISPTFLFNSHF